MLVADVMVLFVRESIVAFPTNVSEEVGNVRVPVLEIVLIIGAANVLFANVSVPVSVTYPLRIDDNGVQSAPVVPVVLST